MTTNKPEVVTWGILHKGVLQDFVYSQKPAEDIVRRDFHGRELTIEPLIRRSDYEALQAECEKLRALLLQSAPIIHAHAGASHMLDGFKPKRNKWDALVEQIDAAVAKAIGEEQ